MSRHIMPLAMLVMIAILAVVFFTGREGQFAAAASRLPDQVLHRAQSLRSEVQGKVVIIQDIVTDETETKAEEPVLLESDVPAGDTDTDTAAGAGQEAGGPPDKTADEPPDQPTEEPAGEPGARDTAGDGDAPGP